LKIKDDDITDFCCSSFDERTKRPDKMITVLPWKEYQNSAAVWRALMFVLPSGISSSFRGEQSVAGCAMKPINYCPFCGTPIEIVLL
jgi:hypothetical protein